MGSVGERRERQLKKSPARKRAPERQADRPQSTGQPRWSFPSRETESRPEQVCGQENPI